ncbi:forkhead box protein R1 [Echinops telfairi]|uniref:Forkhead box protein R1 n=1 Tax=Echinops telfairi TaxID=9371 RepID=A0ABM0ZSW9_ECHTE|nr:forkhead box protein R1 [Echinops telfairi]
MIFFHTNRRWKPYGAQFDPNKLADILSAIVRYRLQIVEPPVLPLPIKPNADGDGPNFEPNLWMWVNPNIVYPPGELEVPEPSKRGNLALCPLPLPKGDRPNCSEAAGGQSLSPSSSEQSPPRKRVASSLRTQELPEEEAEDQDDSSSVALLPPHTRAPLQAWRLHTKGQEGRLWPRPPLNYFHLIALALRTSPHCGLNVQQIYNFARQHFPFFRTAPEGWKNTVRHNLCFRDSFEKVPSSRQREASARSRSCLWRLTEEGRRRFEEEAHTFDAARLGLIQQCMSQPDVVRILFDF